MSFSKEGIGFNPFTKKKCYKNFFVKSMSYESKTITCNYCCKIRHISPHFPIKRKGSNCKQIWVPKGTKPPKLNWEKTLSK